MTALEQLESVLCNPEGKCCIQGSAADRAVVDAALTALREKVAQLEADARRYRWLRDNFRAATPTVQVSWTLVIGSKPLADTTELEIGVAIDLRIEAEHA